MLFSNPHVTDDSLQAKLRRALLTLFIAGAVIAAGVFTAAPAYRGLKAWRSNHLAAQAQSFMDQNQWTNAAEKAEAAFLLRRSNPQALRAMARVLTHATNAAALQFWQQFVLTGQASESDRREEARLAIHTGSLDVAAAAVRALLSAAPNDGSNVWLASQLFAGLGDFPQTLYYATRACLLDPSNPRYRFFLSTLQFDSSALEEQSPARTNIWTLASDATQIGLDALEFLAGRQDLSPDQRQGVIARLKKHPLSGSPQQFLVLDQSIQLAPPRRAEILDQAVGDYKNADPAVLREFAVWLNQHEEFQRTLNLLPLETALTRKDLFIPYLDAFASLGNWEELDKILERREAPIEGVYREAFRARCAVQSGKAPLVPFHWKNALLSAEANPEQLTWLAFYAEKCREMDTAKKAYRALAACLPEPRPAWRALERLTEQSGGTEELRAVVSEMVQRWPADAALRNDLAYLDLLLSKELPQASRTAEELATQFPESLPHRTTLALARYRSNDFPGAMRVYEGRQYDWSLALPGNRAVYAAVLAANGRSADATQQARAIPRGRLREQELELIRSLL